MITDISHKSFPFFPPLLHLHSISLLALAHSGNIRTLQELCETFSALWWYLESSCLPIIIWKEIPHFCWGLSSSPSAVPLTWETFFGMCDLIVTWRQLQIFSPTTNYTFRVFLMKDEKLQEFQRRDDAKFISLISALGSLVLLTQSYAAAVTKNSSLSRSIFTSPAAAAASGLK